MSARALHREGPDSTASTNGGVRPRRDARLTTAIFCAALGFLLLTHGGHFYAADTLIVHLTAVALVDDGGLDIGPIWGAVRGADGASYGRYGLGLSLLHAPLLLVGRAADALFPNSFAAYVGRNVSIYYPENWTIFATTLIGPLCGALAAVTLWQIALALGHSRRVAAGLALLLVVATQTWPASRDGFPHVVVLLLVLLALRIALEWRRPLWSPAALGATLGFLWLVRPFDGALALPPLVAYAALRNAAADHRRGVLVRNVVAFAAPLALAAIVVALHNYVRFGDVLAFDEPGTQAFNADPIDGAHGLLGSSGRGLLIYSPPLFAGLLGLPAFARRRPLEASLIVLLAVAYVGAYATYAHWDGGICWGPRYVVPLVPLLLLPAGELLAAGGVGVALVAVLGVAGVVVQVLGTAVDFHRVSSEVGFSRDTFFDPARSPIREHVRYLTAGRFLDWLPARIFERSGASGVAAYVALPLALLGAAVAFALGARRAEAGSAPRRPTVTVRSCPTDDAPRVPSSWHEPSDARRFAGCRSTMPRWRSRRPTGR